MYRKEVWISVIDGQGGGIGRNIVGRLRKHIPNGSNVIICALGTNVAATNGMLKAGADLGATGENAIVQTTGKSHIILGPMAIISANSMLGELTPKMAVAISSSTALKILIPLNRCNIMVAANLSETTETYIDNSVKMVLDYLKEAQS